MEGEGGAAEGVEGAGPGGVVADEEAQGLVGAEVVLQAGELLAAGPEGQLVAGVAVEDEALVGDEEGLGEGGLAQAPQLEDLLRVDGSQQLGVDRMGAQPVHPSRDEAGRRHGSGEGVDCHRRSLPAKVAGLA
ncbi:MAG: hypothetical protein ACYC1C_05965 [Chloroflexota bacterium]